jgi:hypothetical protein
MMRVLAACVAIALAGPGVAQVPKVEDQWANAMPETASGAEEDAPEIEHHANAMLVDTPAMGGPVEERTGYPPCRPGRGEDNCIQLYEAGVTGETN